MRRQLKSVASFNGLLNIGKEDLSNIMILPVINLEQPLPSKHRDRHRMSPVEVD